MVSSSSLFCFRENVGEFLAIIIQTHQIRGTRLSLIYAAQFLQLLKVTHLLRGGYKRGLYVLQGGQKHHGRFGTPEEEKGGGRAEGSNCRRVSPGDATLGHPLC